MREVEFLPEWYPKVRRRKRALTLQAWVTVLLLAALGLWMLLVQRNVQARQVELGSLSTDVSHSETDLQRLEDLQQVQRDLGRQMEIFLKIGRPVETTKIMTTLEQLMPKDMALLDLTLDTDDMAKQAAAANTLAARAAQRNAATASRAGGSSEPLEPRLRFRLHGVAPTDMDLAEFLARLTARPFFRNVELLISHEKTERGHVMREFEVAFVMDLNVAAPAAGGK